jgi:hypothetical protein
VLRCGGPRRFVVRTTIATLAMVATVLTAVFAGVAFTVRERVRAAVGEKLEAGQRTLAELEQRRARELTLQVAALAENANLKAAVATYIIEQRTTGSRYREGMLAAINRELSALASRTSLDVLAATDPSGTILAVAGRRNQDWPRQARVLAARTVRPRSGPRRAAVRTHTSGLAVVRFAACLNVCAYRPRLSPERDISARLSWV